MSAHVRLGIFDDALGVRMSEAINRLILVADHRYCRITADCVDERLIRAIQILVFVDQDVLVNRDIGMPRIPRDEVISEGNSLADLHRAMEAQPYN